MKKKKQIKFKLKSEFKTKRYYKNELEISESLNLFYRAKLDKISSLLRAQKETNGNPYTLIRELNSVISTEFKRSENYGKNNF